ncbi:hypothetical protein [Clostridium omnivorum]|uniref:Uncharacterized protein n=1 Tax=Clostridium omnivorum TaxID=1604902 RepID=A0ABQ5N9E5_9CLOT|nr:hypothetical protein [Clostridium sp. E14]GLC31660.1 hypothetical protein bsdE14_30700 [Clostridium sp. E14]
MNKLMGFYELKNSTLPTIKWEVYDGQQNFNKKQLWTLRTAVYQGKDINLPRYIGINGEEAKKNADALYSQFKESGMVIYYPYFIAEKSGTLNVFIDKTVIEAVKEDLWNLVTYSKKDVTIIQDKNEELRYIGDEHFLREDELSELMKYVPVVKSMFKEQLIEGESILLEWSYAYNCGVDRNKIGSKYLVFYEARTV